MEVAGVVLGGIPLILFALENYRKALNPAKDYLRRYADKCDSFMNFLGHMDKIVQKLMDKLDIDIKGKPKWEEVAPDRVEWEWRRVKRSFGRNERQSLITDLQYWNTALKNCFEKQEIPSDEGNRTVQELQARFDQKQCDAIRNNAGAIHEAIQSGWGCVFPQTHGGNLYLRWHNDKVLDPAIFNMALSYKKTQTGIPYPSDEYWQEIQIRIKKAAAQIPLSAPASLTPPVVQSVVQKEAYQDKVRSAADYLGYFPDPDPSTSRQIQIHSTATKEYFPKIIPVHSLLSPSNEQVRSRLALSRKQRFGIAASAAWAVLLLCDSAWLSEKLDKDEIQLILDDGGALAQPESLGNTCISHRSALRQPRLSPQPPNFKKALSATKRSSRWAFCSLSYV
ncbi:uncharacterized protein BDZ99DRAFT_526716 [Mytilinidion resinicola]|uniref:DUF7580 domain-containing protein n=1 Tax=Mytilinidion resinicola TaxID=574789 RepID=A0A6A6Y4A7_9PEZI|nr:uncharacterized protein BDZ99DRAFT_526716 [Mytilinidion resinicola]KAF2803358.1 hypothetical protein BDZ99DRAFT_526716 [Mytilinidion resinicola]